jgi:hypothetical protein
MHTHWPGRRKFYALLFQAAGKQKAGVYHAPACPSSHQWG